MRVNSGGTMSVLLLWLLLTTGVEAATVCRVKATGQVVETYHPTSLGICQHNLVEKNPHYGFTATDIEELTVSDEERRTMLKAWDTDPANPDMAKRKVEETEGKADAEAVLGRAFTTAEWQKLRKALK